MRGVVTAIVPDGSYGQIAADDGQRYSYWTSEVRSGQLKVGQAVEFQMWEGQPIEIYAVNAPSPPNSAPPQRAAPPPATAFIPAAAAPAAAAFVGSLPKEREYWITLFTSPAGRISRRVFWLHGVLPIVVANVVLAWIPVIGQIISLVLLWASICIGFKRFHDVGYPGWYSLLYLIPLIAAGIVIGVGMMAMRFMNVAAPLAEIFAGIGFLVGLAQLIFVYIRVGQEGPNEYGPDPLAA